MDQQVINFLNEERVAVLTILVNDGTLHSAAMHFSYSAEPSLRLYFSTDKTTRKAEGMLDGANAQASVVIGISEQKWVSFQAGGELKIMADGEAKDEAKKRHYEKHPNSAKYADDPNTVMLEFIPKWWKYTDFNTSPETVFEEK